MKKLISFTLYILLTSCAQTVPTETPVQAEFRKFFKESLKTYRQDNVKINVDNQDWQNGEVAITDMSNDQIQMTVQLNLKSVEKVLVLKLPESGYNADGSISKACRDDYIFVAGYSIDPDINISELTFRMRSRCNGGPHRVVAWVRTSDGKFYLGDRTFFAFTADGVTYW